jgi:hypothetical protein
MVPGMLECTQMTILCLETGQDLEKPDALIWCGELWFDAMCCA